MATQTGSCAAVNLLGPEGRQAGLRLISYTFIKQNHRPIRPRLRNSAELFSQIGILTRFPRLSQPVVEPSNTRSSPARHPQSERLSEILYCHRRETVSSIGRTSYGNQSRPKRSPSPDQPEHDLPPHYTPPVSTLPVRSRFRRRRIE